MSVDPGQPITQTQQPVVVAAQPAASTPVVHVQPAAPEVVRSRRVVSWRTFAPAAWLGAVLAVVLIVIGAVAVLRAGLDGPLDDPVVSVAGFDHTALLGLIEAGAGIVLLFAALSRDRGAILGVSLLIGIAALVAAIEPPADTLAIERSFAVIIAIAAGVVALVAAIAPSVWRTTERVDVI